MPTINLGTCCGSDPGVGLAPWLAAGTPGNQLHDLIKLVLPLLRTLVIDEKEVNPPPVRLLINHRRSGN